MYALSNSRISAIGVLFAFLIAMFLFSQSLRYIGINPLYGFIFGTLIMAYPMYKMYQRDKRIQQRYMEGSIQHQMQREDMLSSFAKAQGKCIKCYKPLGDDPSTCSACGFVQKEIS